jgi:hypothetical protein
VDIRDIKSVRTNEWTRVPAKTGWHWHRYYVDQKPIHNVCWISVTDSGIFVHYLGDKDQVLFGQSDEDMYWGPLSPPI